VYIGDWVNNRIRMVSASSGIMTTIAGTDSAAYSGDGGLATFAALNGPWGVAVDASGNVYVADYFNSVVRKVTVSSGIISTLAGTGTAGFGGDEGLSTSALLAYPAGIAIDASGNVYISDSSNNCIRKVTALTGVISTVAGTGMEISDDNAQLSAYNGDIIQATSATLYYPMGIAFDASGT
jgi:streptogramin lyase